MPVGRRDKVAYRLVIFSFNQTVVGASVLLTEDETNADGMLEYTGVLSDTAGLGFYPVSSTGTYGTIVVDASGNWTYLADNSQASIQNLRSGEFVSDVFAIFSKDDATIVKVQITIKGVNEIIVTVTNGTGEVTEDVLTDGSLVATGSVTTSDDGEMLSETLIGTYGTLTMQTDGSWLYVADNDQSAVQAMGPGDTLTDVFTVTHSNATAQATVTITLNGADDTPVLDTGSGEANEDDVPLVASGTILATGGDAGENSFTADTLTGVYGTLSIDTSGSWSYSADGSQSVIQALHAGETLSDGFTVYSSDGVTSTTITITINGSDDVPVLSVGSGTVTEDVANGSNNLVASGTLTATGGDSGEQSFVSDAIAGSYGTLVIASNGDWTYVASNDQSAIQDLNAGESLTELFIVTSSDNVTTTTVTITIQGADDAVEDLIPELTGDTGTVTEDDASTLTTSGIVTSTGGNEGEEGFIAETIVGDYGSLTIDTSGSWTYQADNSQIAIQQLTENDTLTDTFTVTSTDTVTTTTVVITIVGTDDVPILSGDSASVTKDDAATLTASGVVTTSGGDAGEDAFIAEVIAGAYGSLTVDSAGNWVYEADNSQSAIQNLYDGEVLTDTFAVLSSDGVTTTDVDITIYGAGELVEETDDITASAWLATGTWG